VSVPTPLDTKLLWLCMPLSIPYMALKALCFRVDRSSVYVHNREQEILQLAGH